MSGREGTGTPGAGRPALVTGDRCSHWGAAGVQLGHGNGAAALSCVPWGHPPRSGPAGIPGVGSRDGAPGRCTCLSLADGFPGSGARGVLRWEKSPSSAGDPGQAPGGGGRGAEQSACAHCTARARGRCRQAVSSRPTQVGEAQAAPAPGGKRPPEPAPTDGVLESHEDTVTQTAVSSSDQRHGLSETGAEAARSPRSLHLVSSRRPAPSSDADWSFSVFASQKRARDIVLARPPR